MSDREAFEKWWTERYTDHKLGQIMSITGELTGIYKDPRAELSWLAWQAAQAQASDPVAVADKGVINWIDGKQFDHEADLYTQPAVNQQLLEALKSCEQCLTFIHGGEPLRTDIPLQLARAAIAAAQEQSK